MIHVHITRCYDLLSHVQDFKAIDFFSAFINSNTCSMLRKKKKKKSRHRNTSLCCRLLKKKEKKKTWHNGKATVTKQLSWNKNSGTGSRHLWDGTLHNQVQPQFFGVSMWSAHTRDIFTAEGATDLVRLYLVWWVSYRKILVAGCWGWVTLAFLIWLHVLNLLAESHAETWIPTETECEYYLLMLFSQCYTPFSSPCSYYVNWYDIRMVVCDTRMKLLWMDIDSWAPAGWSLMAKQNETKQNSNETQY